MDIQEIDELGRCAQCRSLQHKRSDCPVYKITRKYMEEDNPHESPNKPYEVPIYDTHCHLDFVFNRFSHNSYSLEEFKTDHSFPTNFKGCISSFSDPASLSNFSIWPELLKQKEVWGTFGLHPHQAKHLDNIVENNIKKALTHKKAVAVGECGLDYSLRSTSPVDVQKRVFLWHISLAKEYKKPLVIHSREAEDDLYEILTEHNMNEWPIHIHCFTGTHSQLHRFVNEFPNIYFGFTNLVSYPSAMSTHEVARSVPLDRILLETDAPYFVPESSRKHERFSHPGNVLSVAKEIARLKGIDVDVILENCRRNVRKLFSI
jgi:Mg-dependent DNase